MTDIDLLHDRPSAIAAAATLLILDPRLTRYSLELKINALSTSGFLKIVRQPSTFYLESLEFSTENFFIFLHNLFSFGRKISFCFIIK